MTDVTPLVSIIIPFLDEEDYLPACLDSLLAQTYPAERIEVLAIDGGSRDGSRQVVGEYASRDARIALYDNPRRNAAGGLNVGLERAAGEIVLRVDAHAAIAPDYVARCVSLLQERPEIGNVGGPLRPVGETLAGRAIALALESPFSMGGSPFRYASAPCLVDTVYLGAYRRRDLARVGRFNDALHANEDYEFNYRLRRAGLHIWCDPAIRSRTYTRRTLTGLAWQYLRYGYWKARVALLWPRSLRARHLAAPAFLLVVILCAALRLWLPLGLLAGAYAAANLSYTWRAGRRSGAAAAWLTPLVFAVMHTCWAAGFLAGLAPALASRLSRR